jgi:hypothetical protein
LAKALDEVLVNEDLRTSLVAAGIDRASAFSMRTLAELYLDRYELVRAAA